MPKTLTERTDLAPAGGGPGRPPVAKRVGPAVVVLAIVGCLAGVVVLFGWMVDETHFDRPCQQFDAFEAEVEDLPGVVSVDNERWVEAPAFSNPTSWMSVAVDQTGLPGVLEAACATDYPDPMTWSITVRTAAATEVSVHTDPEERTTVVDGARCPEFGFDVARMVDELDRVAPGLAIQPAIWEDDRFALVEVEEVTAGFTHLLPVVEHADDLLAAAGLGSDDVVEINSASLIIAVQPGESDRYLALLTELDDVYAVRSFWADGGGAASDGTEEVQVVAPLEHHAAIEDIIRSSGLHIADTPIRFIE
ncbi:hypothetical protein [Labedella endophytica]|uniref:Uncharacterized protein n=1 Tax=Labedella endophytica TaxID=1523160 RepID=A0A433JP06_9MICO|nr:hypothetical protein [Labedella endophytica]RUQ98098.1 hypothetical protein ELQ94_13805 [Labedella endophytica]